MVLHRCTTLPRQAFLCVFVNIGLSSWRSDLPRLSDEIGFFLSSDIGQEPRQVTTLLQLAFERLPHSPQLSQNRLDLGPFSPTFSVTRL
jgi:hypothetical protein